MKSRWAQRGIHAVTIIVMVAALGTALFCIAASIGLQVKGSGPVVSAICLTLPWFMLLGAVWGIWKRLPYWIALPALGLSVAFLGYLAWDDLVRPPAPPFGRTVPADSQSYATYQRFLKNYPASEVTAKPIVLPLFPNDVAEWSSFITTNRSLLEAAWTNDAPGQAWIEEMAAHKPEGLYPPSTLLTLKESGLDFFKIRRSAQLRWSKFHLCLIDGKPDEAAQLLIPLLRASYHLQSAGTNLLNQMIPVVLLRGTYQRLELIADAALLSNATRREILTTLQEAPSLQLAFENAFLGEQFVAREAIGSMKENRQVLADQLISMEKSFGEERNAQLFQNSILSRFLFNPNRTEREYADYLNESCELITGRHMDAANDMAIAFEKKIESKHLKNPVGRLLASMSLPAFQKVAKNFWQTEDLRVTLIHRLQQ